MKVCLSFIALALTVSAASQAVAQSVSGDIPRGTYVALASSGAVPTAENAAQTPPPPPKSPPGRAVVGSPFVPESAPQPPGAMPADGPATCGAGCAAPCVGACPAPCVGCFPVSCVPKWTFYSEYLNLRPRDAAVAYAVPFRNTATSPPQVPIQMAAPGIADFDYESGYRFGMSRALSDRTALAVTYSHFDADSACEISTVAPYRIRSMVSHPSTFTAASDAFTASADCSLDLDLVDLDYRWSILCDERHTVTLLGGLRYGHLEQNFGSVFAVNGAETVGTSLRFEGGGLRVGIEAERRHVCTGLFIYGRGVASFLAGDTRGTYAQGQAFDAGTVDTGWKGGNVVSIYDLEIGLGWTGARDHLRLSAGYLFSGWHDVREDRPVHRCRAAQQLHRHGRPADVRRPDGPGGVTVLRTRPATTPRPAGSFARDRGPSPETSSGRRCFSRASCRTVLPVASASLASLAACS